MWLAALADGEAAAEAAEGVRPGRRWRRTFGRFDPGREPFATLVLESDAAPQAIVRVEAFVYRRPWLVATPFPGDPALRTLPAVLAGRGRAVVVRYRPRLRCTLRVQEGAETRYAKVLPDARGEAIHRRAVVLGDAAEAGALGFAVAEPVRYDERTRALWQRAVAGAPLNGALLGPEGPALALRMGLALGTLATSGLRLPASAEDEGARARAGRAGWQLARRVPAVAPTVGAVLRSIAELERGAGKRRPRPIHGAPRAPQWLLDGDRLGLVDFDGLALGDPERDVASFQVEMEFERRAVAGAEVNVAFLTGYEALAGPLDGRRLAAYRAQQRLAKALRAAWAPRPDGDARAARHLTRAVVGLEEAVD
jgi:hypothetical protein